MTILIDGDIERLNPHGGIATIWREIRKPLENRFGRDADNPDVTLLTYYGKAKGPNVVMVYDFIADVYPSLRGQQDITWKHRAIGKADQIVCISPWVKWELKRITGRDGIAIPMGTSFTRRTPKAANEIRARYNLPDKFVMMVGKRGYYKNGRAVLQAWPMVDANKDLTLVAVGGEQPSLEEQQFARQHHWRWLNHVPTGDLEALYAAASAVVYPSFYEGYGLPVLDAFACGTPVLCTPNTGMSFAQGLCQPIDPYRPASIANAIEQVVWGRGEELEERLKNAMLLAGRHQWKQTAWAMMEVLQEMHDAA